ncbi:fungal-specific transcription factor domain-containing protein [Aspergillus avenaceus]|uniref:Fungal-specific transcription factor domain-containing protein n=1 Tax=Aspergillus avenaceus TaxID=36643 RepID=A0A5N6U330_ASPAV|nr:fungal-specific transcription factor domain-containing protein [Aspergillus avenaceus]
MQLIKLPRQRAGRPRSKFGCRTCRARHVKCDETPGTCLNCTSTGRKCDGYDVRLPPASRNSREARTTCMQLEIKTGFRWTMTSDERRCFSYFQHQTIPNLLGFFDSPLWRNLVFQIGQDEPAVYHAMVALSAIHQDSEAKGMALSWDHQHNAWHQFALEQLGRAYTFLTKRRSSHDPRLRNVTLMCCLLFVMADLLQGRYDDAFVHLQSGVRILKELEAHRQLVAPTMSEELVEQCLVSAFAHLDIMSAHYGVGGPLLCIDDEWDNSKYNSEYMIVFSNLAEAARAFDPVHSAVFRWLVPCMGASRKYIEENFQALVDRQLNIWPRLRLFMRSFTSFYDSTYKTLSLTEQRGADIIYLQMLVAALSLRTTLLKRRPMALQCFTPQYKEILRRSEDIICKYPKPPTIVMEAGIIPPLYHAAADCQDINVRWQAIQILWSWPHREGPFDSNWIASLCSLGLKKKMLSIIEKGFGAEVTVTCRSGESISPMEVIKLIDQWHARQYLGKSSKSDRRTEGVDCSPLVLMKSVKSMQNWSCVRAFLEYTSDAENLMPAAEY